MYLFFEAPSMNARHANFILAQSTRHLEDVLMIPFFHSYLVSKLPDEGKPNLWSVLYNWLIRSSVKAGLSFRQRM